MGDRGVDGDGQANLTAEDLGQSPDHQGPQACFQYVLGEFVGSSDEGGITHQAHRPGECDECTLLGGETSVRETGDGLRPHLVEVVSTLHVVPFICRMSTALSTGVDRVVTLVTPRY